MSSLKKSVILATCLSVLGFGVAMAQTDTPAAPMAPAAAAPDAAAPAPMMKKPMKMKKHHMKKKMMMKKM